MSGQSILVVGDVMTDIIAVPEGPIVRGSDRRATIRSRPGGSAANQAVWLASFGAPVRFVARVAASDLSSSEAYFRSRGVIPIFSGDPVAPSGVLVTIVDGDGERSFLTDRGANLNLSAAHLPLSLLEGTQLLVASGYSFFAPAPRAAVIALLAEARARGIATAVDPASVAFLREIGAEQFLKWTSGADTIFANLDEALELSGSVDLGVQMQTLGRYYGRVILKRSQNGAAAGGRKGVALSLALPEFRGEVIDSSGAGDAFAAAFLAAEFTGASLDAAMRAGIDAGADAMTRFGGQPLARAPAL